MEHSLGLENGRIGPLERWGKAVEIGKNGALDSVQEPILRKVLIVLHAPDETKE